MDIFSQLMAPSQAESRFYGVALGVVTNNKDPDKLGRVKVKLPWMDDQAESNWARIVSPMAGKERGFYFLPEVDDEVLVAFEHGNPEYPFVMGGLWNGKDKPPLGNDDGKNDVRLIKSRSGHVIRLTDKQGEEKIEIVDKTNKNSIVISTKDNTITISAEADITIQSTKGKLKLSGKGVEINSTAEVKIEAKQNMDLKATAQMNVKGQMVNIN
ncbi:MAG: phage tail protein [Anaerolineae bacterium]|nr:phage tail protein [Anaerolineae bacterium]